MILSKVKKCEEVMENGGTGVSAEAGCKSKEAWNMTQPERYEEILDI